MLRRITGAAVAGVALLAAFGCGGGANDANVSTGTGRAAREPAVVPAAAGDVTAAGLRTVTYQGVQFDVPADWSVHDLTADPTTCVRFDVHAVYLGHPGEDMACPAGLVGRTDAVLVEPTDGSDRGGRDPANLADVSAMTAGGLEVQVAGDGGSRRELAADVPSAGVSVTLTYSDSDATAQQILQSFRTAS